MKKILLAGAILVAGMLSQNANAQGILSNLLSGVANQAVSNATSNTSESTGNIITNLISQFAGDITTSEVTMTGTWAYNKPCVQFESENALTQAGGAVIAEKVESKLASIYKTVGIKSGTLTFTFDGKGNVTYGVGSFKRTGTYVFDKSDKTVTITTNTGVAIKTYVTVVGSEMALTFDGTKFLTLMTTLGSKFQMLGTVVSIAKSYEGMKVGFKLLKK